jgi:hypothetical protein
LLQVKDVPGLRECCADIAEPYRSAFLRLPELFGGTDFLDKAAGELPSIPEIKALRLRRCRPCEKRCRNFRCRSIWPTCAAITTTTASCSRLTFPVSPARLRVAGVTTASARTSGVLVRQPVFRWIYAKSPVWRPLPSRGRDSVAVFRGRPRLGYGRQGIAPAGRSGRRIVARRSVERRSCVQSAACEQQRAVGYSGN